MRIFEGHKFDFYRLCERGEHRYIILRSRYNPCLYIVMHPECEGAIAGVMNQSLSFEEVGEYCGDFVVRGFTFPDDGCPEDEVMEEMCSRPFI